MKCSIPKLHSIKFKSGAFAEDVIFPCEFLSPENLPAINILEGAAVRNLRDIVLIGYEQDGTEHIAGSMRDPKKAAYMFGRGQLGMLRLADDIKPDESM